jgi:hypothetical protein
MFGSDWDFEARLNLMHAFCASQCMKARTRSRWIDGQYRLRWYFEGREEALAFAARFAGLPLFSLQLRSGEHDRSPEQLKTA